MEESSNKKVISLDLPGGGKAWVDQEMWEFEQKFFKAQEAIMGRIFWDKRITNEQYERVKKEEYEKAGLPYTPPDPFKLDFYFIITDKGTMAKDRKTGNVYALNGYEPEAEPYKGEYKYIRDARSMDL